MKVLFATTNPAKIRRYASKLEEAGIDVITLKDINLKLDVKETGKNAIENAYINRYAAQKQIFSEHKLYKRVNQTGKAARTKAAD